MARILPMAGNNFVKNLNKIQYIDLCTNVYNKTEIPAIQSLFTGLKQSSYFYINGHFAKNSNLFSFLNPILYAHQLSVS